MCKTNPKQLHKFTRSLCAVLSVILLGAAVLTTPAAAEDIAIETTAPVAETTAPVAQTTIPVAETTVPVAETTAPVAETTVPVAETTAPVAETTAPVAETTVPVAETTVPVAQTTAATTGNTPADPSTVNVDGQVQEVYQYVVTIEFGSFSFYYDWGQWNVDKIAYEANSTDPAADTELNAPGWYGFDGTANRIGVSYVSRAQNPPALDVTLTFAPYIEKDTQDNEISRIDGSGLVIDLYDNAEFNGDPLRTLNADNGFEAALTFTAAAPSDDEETKVIAYYLSVSGEPYRFVGDATESTPVKSSTPIPLGALTVRVEFDTPPAAAAATPAAPAT